MIRQFGSEKRRSFGEPSRMIVPALALRPAYLHDALITARRFYSAFELEMLGRIAAPGVPVEVERHLPGYSVLTVRFDDD